MNVLDNIRHAEKETDQMIAAATEAAHVALAQAKADQKASLESKASVLAADLKAELESFSKELEKKSAALARDGHEAAATITNSFAAKKRDLVTFIKENI